MFQKRASALIAIVASLSFLAPARADFLTDPFTVSDSGERARVGTDPDGNTVFVWQTTIVADTFIQARARSTSGVFSSVQTVSDAHAESPHVAVDTVGDAAVIWRRFESPKWRIELRYRRADGVLAPPDVLDRGPSLDNPQVAIGANHLAADAFFVWSETVSAMNKSRVKAAGHFLSPQTVSRSGEDSVDPNLAVGTNGDAVVVWTRFAAVHQAWIIEARRISANGTLSPVQRISPKSIDPLNPKNSEKPKVGVADNGDAVIVWRWFDGAKWRIQVRTLAADGSLRPVRTISDPSQDSDNPHVSIKSDGETFIAWEQSDGTNTRVVTRLISELIHRKRFASRRGSDASDSDVGTNGRGDAIAVWIQQGQVVHRTKSADDNYGLAKTLSSGLGCSDPHIVMSAHGQATVVWTQNGAIQANYSVPTVAPRR